MTAWLAVAAAVAVLIGGAVRRRDLQEPVDGRPEADGPSPDDPPLRGRGRSQRP